MEHDDPGSADSGPAGRAEPHPQEASAEVAECLRQRAGLARWRHLLVVSLEAVDAAAVAPGAGACVVYRPAETPAGTPGSSHEPWLPFDDAVFDAVMLYRVTRHDLDIDLLLGEASRVMRPDGHVVVLEHETDFAFAPLPETGPAHLLHGWLRHAGFAHVDIAERFGSRVVAVGHA